jgi:hypothetical protein
MVRSYQAKRACRQCLWVVGLRRRPPANRAKMTTTRAVTANSTAIITSLPLPSRIRTNEPVPSGRSRVGEELALVVGGADVVEDVRMIGGGGGFDWPPGGGGADELAAVLVSGGVVGGVLVGGGVVGGGTLEVGGGVLLLGGVEVEPVSPI